MKPNPHHNFDFNFKLQHHQRACGPAGNVLIYVVVLMLIFGTLGVAMVSLFSTSTASTATSNDARRARYLSEAGVRYAIGELRTEDFDEDYIIDPLHTLTYTVDGAGTFEPNVFGPWFESNANVDSPDIISLIAPFGSLPTDFGSLPIDFVANPISDVWVVNFDYISGFGPKTTTMRDEVNSYSIDLLGNLSVDITADFVANEGERVCFAVEPVGDDQDITEGGDLYVARDARLFFPPFNGAININRVDYAYARLVDDEANNRVILENVTASQFPPPPSPLTAFPSPILSRGAGGSPYPGDFVILSPRNYTVMAEGTSDAVSLGNEYALGMNIYDDSLVRPDDRADITAEDFVTNLSQQETDTRFFEPNLVDYELDIGGGGANQFGSAFYNATRNIGGRRDYCNAGACLFNLGVRVFFLLDFTSQGDGVTFTLLSGPPNNSASSAGGDFELSELMGYAGDSRTSAGFLATDAADRGLDPPKIAVEFDTRTNNDTLDYCSAGNVNQNTRDDPLINNQDAVQYVFWGLEIPVAQPCRDDPSYDDNRHGPGFWQFDDPTGPVISSPAVASDGTIYVGSNDNKVYAINPDGTLKWDFLTGGDVRSSPAIASDGTVYIGSDNGILYAFNPSGPPAIWTRSNPDNPGAAWSLGRPAISSDENTIYVSDQVSRLYAVSSADGTVLWTYNLIDDNRYMPAIDSARGNVYTDVSGNALAALNASTGAEKWRVSVGSDIDSTPVVGPDGTVYFGTDTANSLFAVTPNIGSGSIKWQFPTPDGGDVNIVPALSPDGSVVYAVSNGINNADGFLYAVDAATGTENWNFPVISDIGTPPGTVTSSPAVDPNTGTIYVGSDDNKVIAINPDGTLKWEFVAGNKVNSSPAVNSTTGNIYVGSDDTNVYALTPFDEDPLNLQDLLLTSADLGAVVVDSAVDWLNGAGTRGPWAVRLEVDRCPSKNIDAVGECVPDGDGKFDYELRLWMKQCINADCDNIMTTDEPFPIDDPFFKDTRIDYRLTLPPNLVQSFKLDAAEFNDFFFGFTAAAGAEVQDVTIANFALSFIRLGDSVIDLPEF